MVRAEGLTVRVEGRDLDAYLALPEPGRGPSPALVVLHEIFGPDRHIQEVARRFASEGYVAIAPNLFTGEIERLLTPEAIHAGFAFLRGLLPEVQRDPVRIQERIAARPPEERRVLEALRRIQDPEQQAVFARELAGVTEYLRRRPDVDPARVASVGFCFGGGMSGLLAAHDPKLAAAVIFYGNSPSEELVARIRCPLLGLYGGEDHRITDTVPALEAAARQHHVPFTFHIYPGAPHAFFNDTRPTHRPEAARDAWRRVLGFLGENLPTRLRRGAP